MRPQIQIYNMANGQTTGYYYVYNYIKRSWKSLIIWPIELLYPYITLLSVLDSRHTFINKMSDFRFETTILATIKQRKILILSKFLVMYFANSLLRTNQCFLFIQLEFWIFHKIIKHVVISFKCGSSAQKL